MRVAVVSPPGPYFSKIVATEAVEHEVVQFDNIEVARTFSGPASQLYLYLMDMVFVDAGIRADNAGYDAIFVNAVPDYGLTSLRSATQIPVVGAGQAAIHIARAIGRRFSLVTVWPSSTALLYDRLLRDTGSAGDCVSVRYVHDDAELLRDGAHADIHQGMEFRDDALIDRIERSCRMAIDIDGADTVVLGCTCMSPVADSLRKRMAEPVLDPLKVGFNFTRLLLDSGLSQSARSYPPATASERTAIVSAADALKDPDASDLACDVCVVDKPS